MIYTNCKNDWFDDDTEDHQRAERVSTGIRERISPELAANVNVFFLNYLLSYVKIYIIRGHPCVKETESEEWLKKTLHRAMVLSLHRSADGVSFDSVKNAPRVPVL